MEMQSFVFGMLTVVGIALAVLAIISTVKIIKQGKKIKELETVVAQNITEIYAELGRMNEEIKRECISYTDKRVDKIKVDKQ